MYAAWLELTDFRNHQATRCDFEPGVNIFLGPNGQGKTNIVEALAFFATLASHRVSSDAPLVRVDKAYALARLNIQAGGREQLLELQINARGANRVRLQRVEQRRASDILGLVHTVVFAPEDLALVRGEPAGRRRFFDETLGQSSPRMGELRLDYERVLKQRNALLKTIQQQQRGRRSDSSADGTSIEHTLAVWNQRLAETGAALLAGRLKLLRDLAEPLDRNYQNLAGLDSSVSVLQMVYESTCFPQQDLLSEQLAEAELASGILMQLEQQRQAEFDRGLTLVGPHRDDVLFMLNGLPAKSHASQGEAWSTALAIKLAVFEWLRELSGEDPLLILDDVFAELDQQRRDKLAQLVVPVEQVFLTVAAPGDLPEQLVGKVFHVSGGSVSVSEVPGES